MGKKKKAAVGSRLEVKWFNELSDFDAQAQFLRCTGEREQTFLCGHAEIGIIGDEEIAIDIEIVAELGEMRGGADENAGFNHAADHRLQTGFARSLQSFVSIADSSSFAELHIHTVITFGTMRH